MSINRDNFTHLGIEFQYRLLFQILTDKKFASSIVPILYSKYFVNDLRLIVNEIITCYGEYDTVPNIGSIKIRIAKKLNGDEIDVAMAHEHLNKIADADQNDTYETQKMAITFCKQEELKKAMKSINDIVRAGDYDRYEECRDILKKALDVGDERDDGIDVYDNIDDVLSEDYRNPIPTGIEVLDEYMDGGLSKGELAVVLAPFGVGKTTMMTKIANSAKNLGYNVLQIFFEDMPKVIQRKHISCWTGIGLSDLDNRREEAMAFMESNKNSVGQLKLKRFESDGITIPKIKQYIRKLIAGGFKPDIILLDYIDCVSSSKIFKESWDAEGNVMRQFESLLIEFDVAGWTAVQGNRSSIGADVVESNQMGGSIKKGQIGHFIVSIAKTLEQKEDGTANMAILKSRFGRDGIIFNNAIFDNNLVKIEITEDNGTSFGKTKKFKKINDQVKVNTLMDAMNKAKELTEKI